MSRKTDLEEHIRECYKLIHEYEVIIRTSSEPKEKARAERNKEEQWRYIEGYLAEYRRLVSGFLSLDIAQIEAHYEDHKQAQLLPLGSVMQEAARSGDRTPMKAHPPREEKERKERVKTPPPPSPPRSVSERRAGCIGHIGAWSAGLRAGYANLNLAQRISFFGVVAVIVAALIGLCGRLGAPIVGQLVKMAGPMPTPAEITATPTPTATQIPPTFTPTQSPTSIPTHTPTLAPPPTPTLTPSPTFTPTHTPSPTQSPTPTLTPTPIPPTSTPTPPLSVVTIDDFEQGVDTWAAYSHKGGEPYSKRAQITDAPQGQYAMSWTVSDITEWAIVETSTTFSIDGCSDLALWGKGTGKSGFVVELRCPDYENAHTAILSAVPAWVHISLGLPSTTSDGDFEKIGNPGLDNCRIAFTNNTNDEYYFDDIRLVGCAPIAASSHPTPTLTPPPTPSPSPTPTPTPSPTPITPPTNTPIPLTPTAPADLVIWEPTDGASVAQNIEVRGFVAQTALQGTSLSIIVIAPTDGHDAYFVQVTPVIYDDGTWRSQPVFIGREGSVDVDKSFQICAVLASQQLPTGEVPEFPASPKSCINVTRS